MSSIIETRTLRLPALILGGAGFSYQLHPDPKSIPVSKIIRRAFDAGMRAIDTSPYYEPSEELLGSALASVDVTSKYSRSDYILMTKVGRVSAEEFNYSPEWIRTSVSRSLDRLGTSYLDVVFCHDVEFVSPEEAIEAVGALFELSDRGIIKHVGISGYSIDRLIHVAKAVLEKYQRPLDIVQNWSQLNLLNSRLERYGIPELRKAGVSVICSSSPLASGLLRSSDVPSGKLGDWHPAPEGLRKAVRQISNFVEAQGSTLAALALRFSLARASRVSRDGVSVHTIIGICSIGDVEENLLVIEGMLRPNGAENKPIADTLGVSSFSRERETADLELHRQIQETLGEWAEFDFQTGKRVSRI
ncbi:uncharacterized protein N7511_001367 [Penicillium nucicola]|uniref:uncharacterized protein n=1 Tax=Penicillium nucicola TaxID=1850975 RepID=UPI002545B05F|nr:uncharacterized protein N7511_001367 [Penicillium nucicola]KAJ5776356.1 hypothetical protein N7511_001367 [Penicillium nucicola]